MKSDLIWQIVSADPQLLRGSSVAVVAEHLGAALGCSTVSAFDFDVMGAPSNVSRELEGGVLSLERFAAHMNLTRQVVWGTLHFSSLPDWTWGDELGRSSLSRLGKRDAILRMADNSYYYLYTKSEAGKECMQRLFPSSETRLVSALDAEWSQ